MKYWNVQEVTVKSVDGKSEPTIITYTEGETTGTTGENKPTQRCSSVKVATPTDTAMIKAILQLNFPYETWYWESKRLIRE